MSAFFAAAEPLAANYLEDSWIVREDFPRRLKTTNLQNLQQTRKMFMPTSAKLALSVSVQNLICSDTSWAFRKKHSMCGDLWKGADQWKKLFSNKLSRFLSLGEFKLAVSVNLVEILGVKFFQILVSLWITTSREVLKVPKE